MEGIATKDSFRYSEDLKSIRMKRKNLLAGSKLFSDKEFPMDISLDGLKDTKVSWRRIKEFDDKPALFLNGGPTGGHMEPGIAGDPPLLSIMTAIAHHPKLLPYIFPPGQDFDSHEYCGLFYFRFWKMGRWVYVMVDDKLPVIGGKGDKRKNRKGSQKEHSAEENTSDGTGKKDDSLTTKEEGYSMVGSKESINSKNLSKTTKDDANSLVSGATEKQGQDTVQGENDASAGKKMSSKETVRTVDTAKDDETADSASPELKERNKKSKKPPHHTQVTPENKQQLNDHPSAESKTSKKSNKDGESGASKDTSKEIKSVFVNLIGTDGMRCYWAALLEKAYAKFCGGYHRIPKIGLIEKLMDVTGGVIEFYYASHLPDNFFLELKSHSDHNCVILTAPNQGITQDEPESEKPMPIFYALTQVTFVDFRRTLGHDKTMGFVKVKNPFGEPKWNEGWKEACSDWKILPKLLKEKHKMSTQDMGEFYLTYNNFIRAFSTTVVAIVADGENYNCEGYFGFWMQPALRYTLCYMDEMRFHEFSQLKIWIRDPNSDDELPVEVVISLVQDGRCCCSERSINTGIKFYLFCLEPGRMYCPPLGFEFFRYNRPVACSNYSNEKGVAGRFILVPGHYLVVVVPDMFNMDHPCLANDYLLRVIAPAKFPKPPPPHMAVTFCNSDNLNIYYNYAEVIEESKIVVAVDPKSSTRSETDKDTRKEKGKGKKKKKH